MDLLITHLQLGQVKSGEDKGRWVSECGHWTDAEHSTDSKSLVTCRLCKRTRAYGRLEAITCCGIDMACAEVFGIQIYRCRHRATHPKIYVRQSDDAMIRETQLTWL